LCVSRSGKLTIQSMNSKRLNTSYYLKIISCVVILILNSCSFHTAISYRVDKQEEYVKGDGFMISCENDRNYLVIGTYTPDTWGNDFYYGYLKGPKTDKKIFITSVAIRFPDSEDNLTLDTVREKKVYWFGSNNLKVIIDRNRKIIITVNSTDLLTGKKDSREFVMFRRKRKYPTGHFPHR
jgi:hypothetical protein